DSASVRNTQFPQHLATSTPNFQQALAAQLEAGRQLRGAFARAARAFDGIGGRRLGRYGLVPVLLVEGQEERKVVTHGWTFWGNRVGIPNRTAICRETDTCPGSHGKRCPRSIGVASTGYNCATPHPCYNPA